MSVFFKDAHLRYIIDDWDQIDNRIKGVVGRIYYKMTKEKIIDNVVFEKKEKGIALYREIK